MIDIKDIQWRCSCSLVYFRNFPKCNFSDTFYIENEYHEKLNRYIRRKRHWLQKHYFGKYDYGNTNLIYLPSLSEQIRKRKNVLYRFPFLSKELSKEIPEIKTTDLLNYLDDPEDARFLKPGFLFYKESRENGISVFEYYPLIGIDNKALTYKDQIEEILKAYKERTDKYRRHGDNRGIGNSGLYSSVHNKDENYADNMFESFDQMTRAKLHLFRKQVIELQQCGVPFALLEGILHQHDKLSQLFVTKKYKILLPDYNNMEIKMEPLVKAVFFLFLKHPEGIRFKHLPEYREELTNIYKELRPLGLNKRSLQSIEDVTNPLLNSINEKCARIRAAFVNQFDEHLAKNYFVTGERGMPKKITLPRDLVVWE